MRVFSPLPITDVRKFLFMQAYFSKLGRIFLNFPCFLEQPSVEFPSQNKEFYQWLPK